MHHLAAGPRTTRGARQFSFLSVITKTGIGQTWSVRLGRYAVRLALLLTWTAGYQNRPRRSGRMRSKRAIRDGVDQTTVTCVLIGAHTWEDRWVRYEIARSVERGNGLFAVRINGIADPKTQQRTVSGWNPLAYVGVGKIKSGDYLLFENINGQWSRYQDHPLTLPKPAHVPDMSVGYVQPLSVGLSEYDYVAQNGSEHLDPWIANASAKAAK